MLKAGFDTFLVGLELFASPAKSHFFVLRRQHGPSLGSYYARALHYAASLQLVTSYNVMPSKIFAGGLKSWDWGAANQLFSRYKLLPALGCSGFF